MRVVEGGGFQLGGCVKILFVQNCPLQDDWNTSGLFSPGIQTMAFLERPFSIIIDLEIWGSMACESWSFIELVECFVGADWWQAGGFTEFIMS